MPKFRTTHDGVTVHEIMGDLEIKTTHSEINASGISGNVVAQTTHDQINISLQWKKDSGSTTHSDVTVTALNPELEAVEIATSHNNVTLKLPESTKARLSMTGDKKPHSDFESDDEGIPVRFRLLAVQFVLKN